MQRIRGVGGAIVGHYRVAAFSGLTTGLGANAPIFSLRSASTGLIRAAITRLKVTAQIITAFTAAQELQVAAFLASAFTASDSGGTSAMPAAGQNSMLQVTEGGYAPTLTDLRIAAAVALTPGTRTLDTNPFLGALGAQLLAAASAAENILLMDYDAQTSDQRMPVILMNGGPVAHGSSTLNPNNAQGIVVTSPIAQGAGGTVRYLVEAEWLEFNWDTAEVQS